MSSSNNSPLDRREILKQVSADYFKGLLNYNFDHIPYHDQIILRAPVAPGGVNNPLQGKGEVFDKWWKPLEQALAGVQVRVIDHFYNESLTGIITEAEVTLAGPGITLRVADRFTVDADGKILEQENHFDASPLSGAS